MYCHCTSHREATHVCCQPGCRERAFLCDDDTCRCSQNHRMCPRLPVGPFFEMLKRKRSQSENTLLAVRREFHRMR